MTTKHTPGTWMAGAKSVTAPETEDRLPLDVRLYGGNAQDHRANARLIAAAPDLLDALKQLVSEVAGYQECNGDQGIVLHEALAAIAKATA